MKKLCCFLGAVSFVWLMAIGGADFEDPFLENALVILGGVVIGIGGLISHVWLIQKAKRKEESYWLLRESRIRFLRMATRRIL